MFENSFTQSNKAYVVTSSIAIGMLLVVFIVSYVFFQDFQNATDSSKINYDEYIKLEELSKKYKLMQTEHLEAAILRRKLDPDKWYTINNDIYISIQGLLFDFRNKPKQLERINNIAEEQNKLFGNLVELDTTFSSLRNSIKKKKILGINSSLHKIDSIKKHILEQQKEDISKLVTYREEKNESVIRMMVISSAFALLLLLFSLYRLFVSRKLYFKTNSLLKSILNASTDIVRVYTPVYDNNKEVIDFKIEYASSAKEIYGYNSKELLGRLVTEVYPELKVSGELQKLIDSFSLQKSIEEVSEIDVDEEKITYLRRFFPSQDDIKVIISDISKSRKYEKDLSKLNHELKLSNDLLKEAEKIAEMGSYIWFMKVDHTILSDNVYRILGYKPQEFASSSVKFREFVHPDDLELYDKNINEAYQKEQAVEFIFRVITKENVIKHLYTNGAFNEHDNKITMIGIIQDVTKQVETELQLQQKNAELVHQNVELESFNRIASHDLQEPLRKVQMYLSRLTNDDELSEKNKQYIERANSASLRMRTLINNLLSFSRINRKEDDLSLVNLNNVLQDVIDDLSLTIEEANAVLEYTELPAVKGIEFQLNQLFNNLISNAIKYRNKEKDLKVTITSKKIEAIDIDEPFVKNHQTYYLIKVIDNGIGFDNNMRDKIFEMFQRLHLKHEYSGTGIGLAICKKIVLKHQGYIQATGIKGSGVVFTIYLPA
ncbi:sensor histidine kinase [Tenacibaculum mesophilum]|uniref:sensor histidine kinase n=1 Tax=Tenacibaculum mesophilum TaxID=104268 RepID=UPI00069DDFD8|nr:ATP-binding protein [Tenacibaculum mesophilum]